jgi:hypothetical protein
MTVVTGPESGYSPSESSIPSLVLETMRPLNAQIRIKGARRQVLAEALKQKNQQIPRVPCLDTFYSTEGAQASPSPAVAVFRTVYFYLRLEIPPERIIQVPTDERVAVTYLCGNGLELVIRAVRPGRGVVTGTVSISLEFKNFECVFAIAI